jgi:hypothetical protein
VDAGLLKTVFFGVLFKRKKNPAKEHAFFAGPYFCLAQDGSI